MLRCQPKINITHVDPICPPVIMMELVSSIATEQENTRLTSLAILTAFPDPSLRGARSPVFPSKTSTMSCDPSGTVPPKTIV